MDILDLFKGAIISVESRSGRKQIWIHIGNQHFPLVIRPASRKKLARQTRPGHSAEHTRTRGKKRVER
jgi:hypothetical protein